MGWRARGVGSGRAAGGGAGLRGGWLRGGGAPRRARMAVTVVVPLLDTSVATQCAAVRTWVGSMREPPQMKFPL